MQFSEIVRKRTDVSPRTTFDHKARDGAFHTGQLEFEYFDLDGIEFYRFFLSSEFVRGASVDLLRGKRRRSLLSFAKESLRERRDLSGIQLGCGIRVERFAVGVMGVGGKPEADGAGVAFAAAAIKPCEACGATQSQNQDARCKRVKRAEMANLPKANQAPNGFDDIVRSFPARFIDHEDSVNRRRLSWSGHDFRRDVAGIVFQRGGRYVFFSGSFT